MTPSLASLLADLVLLAHLAVILFNVGGLIVIPLGGWLGWRFVRIFWWRALHVAVLAAVALQPLLGRACFLTLWQGSLMGAGGIAAEGSALRRWIDGVIFWPLPIWVFALIYVAVFLYTLALWRLVPPRRA